MVYIFVCVYITVPRGCSSSLAQGAHAELVRISMGAKYKPIKIQKYTFRQVQKASYSNSLQIFCQLNLGGICSPVQKQRIY